MGLAGVTLTVRRATASGVLYPAAPAELARTVDALLDHATPLHPQLADGVPRAIIVPHGSLALSGPTAAVAYAHLRPWRHSLRTVVVLGPCSPSTRGSLVLSAAGAFETPLGEVTVDHDACLELIGTGLARFDDDAHATDANLEVQLPFLQRLLVGDWSLVPVLCAGLDPREVADVLEPLWNRPGTLVVVSSDLSQGHDHRTARYVDSRTSAAISARWWEALGDGEVSASSAVRGILELARRHDQRVTQLELSTSADAGGAPDAVTGYGSFIVR